MGPYRARVRRGRVLYGIFGGRDVLERVPLGPGHEETGVGNLFDPESSLPVQTLRGGVGVVVTGVGRRTGLELLRRGSSF